MRGRAIGLGLLGLGAFLLAGALATRLFLVPALVTLPLDQKADPVALGTGVDFFNLGEQKQYRGLDVTVHQHVLGHPSAAGASSDVAVWEFGSTMIDSAGNKIQYGTYQVCLDRHTTVSVSCPSAFVTDASGAKVTEATIHGLTLTFPFHTEKKSYDVFDSTSTKAFPARFAGTETLHGLRVYRFEQTVPETVLESTDVPGAMAGAPDKPSVKADIVYSNTRTWWVEPTSGVIVNAAEHPVTVFRGPDGTTGATFLAGSFTADQKSVAKLAAIAVTSRDQINLITTVVPLTLLGLGVLALIGGGLLVRRNRADEDAQAPTGDQRMLEPQAR
jgi:hypothetical protein